uniref:Ig-like domain-containing protein n=1 Tax=Parascaris univalens TaxID=6257 RepID=A0A914ZRE4_PARUN
TISILLLLIVRLSSVLTDVVFDPEPYAVFTNTVKLIKTSNEKYYVPLGRNYVFRCHAMYWIAGEKLSPVEEENPFMWTYVNPQREDSHRSDSGKALYLFAVQYMHEGHYDCHIADVDGNEFVSRITLIVQECGIWTGEEDFDERRNPCQYGACVTEPYPEVPFLHLVKCKCVTQYTGEFCDG